MPFGQIKAADFKIPCKRGYVCGVTGAKAGLTPSTISFHQKLEDVGAVTSRKEQYYNIYSMNEDIFKSTILDIIKEESQADLQAEEEEYGEGD